MRRARALVDEIVLVLDDAIAAAVDPAAHTLAARLARPVADTEARGHRAAGTYALRGRKAQ